MNAIKITPIGTVQTDADETKITLFPKYRDGLKGLADYSHVQVLWWADGCDNSTARSTLVEHKPYKKGPEQLGVFALRSPERPNPIAVSHAELTYIEQSTGSIGLAYIDAFSGSPVLDLKPYTPSMDRIAHFTGPAWCSYWPESYEESGCFDWESEFNF